MKHILLFTLLAACLPIFSFGQNTDEIIGKHIQAIGGEQKWNRINSLIIEQTTDDENVLISSKEYFVRNKFYRKDLTYTGRTVSDNSKKYFLLINKTGSWKSLRDNKLGKLEPLSVDEIAQYLKHNILDDPFVNYKQLGTSIVFMNREYFNEKDYYKLLIKMSNGKQEYCYLDPSTFLMSLRVALGGENESSIQYISYNKNIDGMTLPAKIITSEGITTFQKIVINPLIKEAQFQLPSMK